MNARLCPWSTTRPVERGFFEHVLDAFEGFVGDEHGTVHAVAHRRGLKVWFGPTNAEASREHYEAQLIRVGDDAALEIGFHAEHRDTESNVEVIGRLVESEPLWRGELGDDAEDGHFIGTDRWRRISEVWPPPDPDDPEATMEVAGRLADYVDALAPVRPQD